MKNLPTEFLNRMQALLGEEYSAFLASYDRPAKKGIRLNLQKFAGLTPETDALSYEQFVRDWKLTPLAHASEWQGMKREFVLDDDWLAESGIRPGKHAYHEAGLYYMQEPSAMEVAAQLDIQPFDRVLDLCAAPGGKSTQAADMLDIRRGGFIVANEYVPKRAQILSSNFERMGIANGMVLNEDTGRLAERFPAYFTRIIVDAPCSGEGMFRKDDTAISEWSPENVELCVERQRMILKNAVSMLAPGGKMSYSTCTFEPCENEEMVAWLCAEYPELKLLRQERYWPHKCSGEGHFLAVLQNGTAEVSEAANVQTFAADQAARTERDAGAHAVTGSGPEAAQTISQMPVPEMTYSLRQFGTAYFLIPDCFPDVSGLKVQRCGLKLGTAEKNRFEPDHALTHALALKHPESNGFFSLLDTEKTGAAAAQQAAGKKPEKLRNTAASEPYRKAGKIKKADGTGKGRRSGEKAAGKSAKQTQQTAAELAAACRKTAEQQLNLAASDPRVEQYLRGLQIAADTSVSGWMTVAVDGIPLGLGKAVNGQIKNHYPKGLRWV